MDPRSSRPHQDQITAVLIAPDRIMAEQFLEMIAEQGSFQIVLDLKSYPTTHSLDVKIRQTRPEILLLDVASDPATASRLIAWVTSSGHLVHVVCLSPRSDSALLLGALRLGAIEFLHAPFELQAQREAVNRLHRFRQADSSPLLGEGRVVVFSSTKPGSGASTIALQTAFALRQNGAGAVLLAELDVLGGCSAFQIGSNNGLMSDCLAERAEFTPESLRDSVIELEGMDYLPAPHRPFDKPIDPDDLGAFIECARHQYDWVLIDLPTVFQRWSLVMFSNADLGVLVSSPELASMHLTRKALRTLDQLGFPQERFQLVLNRMSNRSELSKANIEKLLGFQSRAAFPNDYFALNRSAALGRSLESGSELYRAVIDFAADLRVSLRGGAVQTASELDPQGASLQAVSGQPRKGLRASIQQTHA